jgi:hypothetical protein
MINWLQLIFHLLWICGLALILAAFSYADWLAHVRGVRTRHLLGSPTFQRPLSIGLALISLGLIFLSRSWLEQIIWAILAVLVARQAWGLWRDRSSK